MSDMISTTLLPEPWTRYGACLEVDPDLWFPVTRNEPTIRDAKRICNTVCEVRDQCLEYALRTNQKEGVWGGLTSRQRRRLRSKEKGMVS